MSKQTEADISASTAGEKYDCIIVGAGHNGLATGLVLARNGQKVLVLEKNNYVGGMGGLGKSSRAASMKSARAACFLSLQR